MTRRGTAGVARWCAIVPQKSLVRAKSRLELEPADRRLLATAMLRDTLAAVTATPAVAEVVVLWDDDADRGLVPAVRGLDAAGLGLNEALEWGASEARRTFPDLDVAVVPGDLPALLPAELDLCLQRAGGHARAFLADASGVGTTVLTTRGGRPLLPAYGAGSAAAHAASGATRLDPTAIESVRSDVDDLAALSLAAALGLGPATRAFRPSRDLVIGGPR